MGEEKQKDIEWLAEILEESPLLFYGELEYHLDKTLKLVFAHDLKEYGFEEIPMLEDFATAYWLIISLMHKWDFIDYGTSPRGAWLTEKGERFKKMVLAYDAIQEAAEHIHKKYNS